MFPKSISKGGVMYRRLACLLVLLGLTVSGCTRPECPPLWVIPRVALPEDDAPHDMEVEWWYYTGHLVAGEEQYGFEMVVFQVMYLTYEGTMAHFAVTDKAQELFAYDIRYLEGLEPPQGQGFDLSIDDWRMRGFDGEDYLKAGMSGYAIELDLVALKEPVLHGGDGLIEMGSPVLKSYYYTRPRMDVTGTLEVQGVPREVTGTAWMDHQWGDFFAGYYLGVGWDWFSIQLEDFTELMLFNFRVDQVTERSEGSFFDELNCLYPLDASDFQVLGLGTWVSPHSGAEYPMGWHVSLPDHELELTLDPVMEDQELCMILDTCYWEGPVAVSGTRQGEPIAGQGYVEMTGYQ
jgi:predicted secreted hydrolase